ncbi:MAG: hypothetical protein KAK04_15945 [Cyclobacteriaceae bacterium]|nr:hypothetical protein [Cyclobacteriaceae bacterium]
MKKNEFVQFKISNCLDRLVIKTILLLLILPLHFTNVSGQGNTSLINDKVDWKSFLSRHDLVWEKTPYNYYTAPFLGNGLLGAMFYCPDGENIRLDIGRSDVVEHRDTDDLNVVDNGRLPIGHFKLTMDHEFDKAVGRLDLFNAEANFEISAFRDKKANIRTLVFKEYDAILVELESPDDLQFRWMFYPDVSIVPGCDYALTRKHFNPFPEMSNIDGINICVQERDAGGSYTTAWKVIESSDKVTRLLITVQDSYPGHESVEKAVENIKQLSLPGKIEEQISAHRKWWNNFYTKSFISVPHEKMESVYWINQYKFGSMMRENAPVPGNMGPWYKTMRYPGIWWNMDTQSLYSSLHISNQLELASTLSDYIIKMNDALIASVPEKYRYNSAALCRATGPALQGRLTWPGKEFPERSNLTYLCYYLWEYYRMSMDEEYLQKHFFPLLRRSVNYILHEISVDKNGIIHTPYGHSPESITDMDTNYDLSSLKWGCQTLLKINEHLDLRDPLKPKWQEVYDNIRFPTDENGFSLSANHKARPMKHWSHLFQIYPYYLVNWEQLENRDVILKSIEQWASPKIGKMWVQTGISSIYSSIRDGEKALEYMNVALATSYTSAWSSNFFSNTLHGEKNFNNPEWNPCSNVYGGLNRMLQDMLIQSWGDKIRIFPAVSKEWNDVVFHNLRAEGGFEISAKRKDGKLKWVRIKNNAGGPCLIEAGFEEKFEITGGRMKKVDDGIYKIDIKKGEEAILYINRADSFEVAPLKRISDEFNPYGLR